MPSRKSLAAAAILVLFFAAMNHSALAAIFSPGEFITYGQDDWGTIATPASDLLLLHFFDVNPNGVRIGTPGAAGNSAVFSTPEASLVYLPATGPPFPLDNDYSDPTSTEAGIFGGHMLALQLDVDFSDAGYLLGPSLVSRSATSFCLICSWVPLILQVSTGNQFDSFLNLQIQFLEVAAVPSP